MRAFRYVGRCLREAMDKSMVNTAAAVAPPPQPPRSPLLLLLLLLLLPRTVTVTVSDSE